MTSLNSSVENENNTHKYMDKQAAMSFVIKALYFPKESSKLHRNFQRIMNYEDLLFTSLEPIGQNMKEKNQ